MGECKICGKSTGRNKYCCSMDCYAKYKTQTKICVVCGKAFNDPKSNVTVTCSRECSRINRQRKENLLPLLDKAHEAAKNHPLTGRFETHVNAKTWVIQSPDGIVYECRNLLKWLRDHEDMLDGTHMQAYYGFTKMKQSLVGQWKGWTLIRCEEK